MGNETSILKKSNVSTKPRFTSQEWSLFDAQHENQSFSAFIFNDNQFCYDFTKWKHVRHPYLVKFYEAGLYKNKKYILTEPVIPIREILGKYHRFSKLSGLHNIGDSLSFLHEKCKISVNNLSIDTIFVSKNDPNELWKIGSLYWCSSPGCEDSEFVTSLITYHTLNGTLNHSLPVEDRDIKNLTMIDSVDNIQRRDVYAFVSLINELFYNHSEISPAPKLADILSSPDESSTASSTTTSSMVITNHNLLAHRLIEQFNSYKPDQRPTVSAILGHQLFANCPYIQLKQFLANFSTYSDQEKYSFLEVLIENLRQFPDQSLVVNIFTMIVSSRLIMSNRIIYEHVMPYFLIPSTENNNNRHSSIAADNGQLTSTESSSTTKYVLTNGEIIHLNPFIEPKTFREMVIPHLIKLYCVHDYKIRILLLQYLPHYGSLISKQCLKKILLPQILLGIKDSDKYLVSLTFRAMAVLIDLFDVQTVLGGGSHRTRYFTAQAVPDADGRSNVGNHSNTNNSNTKQQTESMPISPANSIQSNVLMFDEGDKLITKLFPVGRRSSPDGDETITTHGSQSNLKFSSVETSENEWPDWDDSNHHSRHDEHDGHNDQKQTAAPETSNVPKTKLDRASKIAELVQEKSALREKLQTFDIKELDFKEVNYTKEIDNLFMDMAPVLKFSNQQQKKSSKQKQQQQQVQATRQPEQQSPLKIDPTLFEAKINIDDDLLMENSAWNSDSLDWNEVNGNDDDDDNQIPQPESNDIHDDDDDEYQDPLSLSSTTDSGQQKEDKR